MCTICKLQVSFHHLEKSKWSDDDETRCKICFRSEEIFDKCSPSMGTLMGGPVRRKFWAYASITSLGMLLFGLFHWVQRLFAAAVQEHNRCCRSELRQAAAVLFLLLETYCLVELVVLTENGSNLQETIIAQIKNAPKCTGETQGPRQWRSTSASLPDKAGASHLVTHRPQHFHLLNTWALSSHSLCSKTACPPNYNKADRCTI